MARAPGSRSQTRTLNEESRRQAGPDGVTGQPPPGRRPAEGPAPDPRLHGPDALRRRGALLRRLLATGDWLALFGALCVTTLASSTTDVSTLFWALLLSPVWILVVKLQGLYDNDHRRIRHSTFDELPGLLLSAILGVLALDALLALSPVGALSSSSAILIAAIWLPAGFVWRSMTRFVWHQISGIANGLVVGTPARAAAVARRVAIHPEARLRLVGYLGPDLSEGDDAIDLLRLGAPGDVAAVATEHGVERVVVIDGDLVAEEAGRLIAASKDAGLGLTFLPRHFGLLGPGVELNRVAEMPVLDFRFSDPSRSTMVLKRGMDIAVSAAFLTLLSPLFLLISALILLDSGRPIFFRQARAGEEGRPFRMVKFRTMVLDAEKQLHDLIDLEGLDEPMFKLENDPRVTRIGRLLRRTSLDELPQFINVLRGTMSLVGPRPEEESIVALYDERQRARLAVKPGLTGPMQVYGRGDLSFEERLALERDYLDNISIGGDLAILIRTPVAAVRGNGAY